MPLAEPEQRDASRCRRSGSVVVERALQEADAAVEQVEALERVADEVEIGLQVGHRLVDGLRLLAGRGRGPELVGDPDLAVRQLVGGEVARA